MPARCIFRWDTSIFSHQLCARPGLFVPFPPSALAEVVLAVCSIPVLLPGEALVWAATFRRPSRSRAMSPPGLSPALALEDTSCPLRAGLPSLSTWGFICHTQLTEPVFFCEIFTILFKHPPDVNNIYQQRLCMCAVPVFPTRCEKHSSSGPAQPRADATPKAELRARPPRLLPAGPLARRDPQHWALCPRRPAGAARAAGALAESLISMESTWKIKGREKKLLEGGGEGCKPITSPLTDYLL